MLIGIILTVIDIIFFIYCFYLFKKTKQVDTETQKINYDLKQKEKELLEKKNFLENEILIQKHCLEIDEAQINNYKKELNELQNNISKTIDNQQELSQRAFENYCEILENKYKEQEEEYDTYKDAMQTAYSNLQLKLLREAEETKAELDKIKATRAAAIQAQIREKEIEKNKDNYRLNISEVAIKDIKLLKSIQKDISNAIVIDKIIWSNYYQPLAKIKFPKIIGKDTTCGIYKLTNLVTGEVYIGQSVDICDRWKQHCKNALGVGNNSSNSKLYKSMREVELYNFTFEIIEECPNNILDEKEKYYINLYDAYNFGLNGNRGNNT